jgi:hypothetical protein
MAEASNPPLQNPSSSSRELRLVFTRRVEQVRRQGEGALGRKPVCLAVQVVGHARGIMDDRYTCFPRAHRGIFPLASPG